MNMNEMNSIAVSDKSKIFTIKEKFNLLFPFLKIDLFLPGTKSSEYTKALNEKYKTLEEFRVTGNTDTIIISPQMTVSDLEKIFKTVYNLSTQVYRQSGKIWLETTVTDSWTLEEQNKQGESLSKNNTL